MASASRARSTVARAPKIATSPGPPRPARCSAAPGNPIVTPPGFCPPRGGSTPKSSGGLPPASRQCAGGLPHSETPGRAHQHGCRSPSPAACLCAPSARRRRQPPAPPALPGAHPTSPPRGAPSTSPTQGRKRPMSASTPSGTGGCHAHPARELPRLRTRVSGALSLISPRPPQGQQRHPTVPQAGPTATAAPNAKAVGGPHRVHHACGNRHCPQWQPPKTPPWLHHHLVTQRPGPHFLLTLHRPGDPAPLPPLPSALRVLTPCSTRRLTARQRLATDERCLGTGPPRVSRGPAPRGRQLPYHPPSMPWSLVGASPRTARPWRPSRAHFCGPVKALSPLSRARCKADRRHAGLLEQSAPQGWTSPWNVPSQATTHGHAACTSLAPSVFQGALANHRLVSRRTAPSRAPPGTWAGPARAPPPLDVIALLRRFLPHCLAARLHDSPPRRRAPCQLVRSRARPSTCCSGRATPARAAAAPARGPRSDLWRPAARR